MSSGSLELFFTFFSRLLMLLLVMPVTNAARGLVAKWMGDDTADRQDRLTLNPMSHLDPLGSLMILLIGIGWSKPMPISFSRMKNMRRGVIMVSLAGPVTHFLYAILCYHIIAFIGYLPASAAGRGVDSVVIILLLLAQINVCLGVINLLPLPPMDGFQILNQFAGPKFHNWYYSNYQRVNQMSTIIILVLFICGRVTGGLFDPLGWLINIFDFLLRLTTLWIPLVLGK